MIYVPSLNNGNCVVIQNSDTIRVYDTTPYHDSNIHYIDYYPRLNYQSNEGYAYFSQYSNIPSCRQADTNIMNRYDINYLVPLVLICFILCILLNFRLIKDFFFRK